MAKVEVGSWLARILARNLDMKTARWLLIGLVALVTSVLLSDYFTPARLEVDLNAPRFRLVRHRTILADQEFEMEWKHINDWSESASESRPVFGERSAGGVYAWEWVDLRFERLYEEFVGATNDEWTRENDGTFEMNTRELMNDHGGRVRSKASWVGYRPHQKTLVVSKEEIEAAETAGIPRLRRSRSEGSGGVDKRRLTTAPHEIGEGSHVTNAVSQ